MLARGTECVVELERECNFALSTGLLNDVCSLLSLALICGNEV